MIIYLLRHGDAVDAARFEDSERPLSDFGRRQASAVGAYLAGSQAGIQQIYCSPLLRAQQTGEVVQRELGQVPIQSTEVLLSSRDPRDIVQELKRNTVKSVLLIGHEPHLSRTISLLLWGDIRSRVEMKKCSLACVSTPDPPEEGRGVLQWLVSSDQTLKEQPGQRR
jgi:phosphohistidine phosphatase